MNPSILQTASNVVILIGIVATGLGGFGHYYFGKRVREEAAAQNAYSGVLESKSTKAIQSITIEARLTCNLKDGAELPPAEVPFVPVGDAHAYFKGPAGTARLEFKSPVNFRRQEPNKIVVINDFALESGSVLQHKPLEVLKNYSILSVPVVTIVYGKSFEKFTLLEVSLIINGVDVWYGSYKYDVPFQVGPRFEIPLNELHKKL